VNLALGQSGGGSGRPAGSAFKPFVLAEALEQGYSLRDRVPAPATYVPKTVSDAKPVHNYTRRGYGQVTLDEATRRSINTAYVGLAETIGVEAVAQRAIDAGMESLPEPSDIGPSVAIGAYETSPLELAAAYGAFAADGHRLHASPLVSVTPPAISLEDVPRARGGRVMSADTARTVTTALQGVVESGTATNAAMGRPVAAKTGTSNDYADAWLVGYSPQLVGATWVGYPAGGLPMHDVGDVSRVTGGSIPASIWRDVMSVAHEGLEPASFPAPDGPPAGLAADQETVPTAPPPPPTTSRPTTTRPEATNTTKPATTTSRRPTTTRPASSTTTEAPGPTTTRPPSTTTTQPAPTTTRPPSTTTTQPPAPTTTRPPSTTTTTTTTRPPSTTTTRPPSTTTTEPRATTTTVRASTTTKPGKAHSRAPAAEPRLAAG
ncbi:MAG: penicillin-binding transpeptidase domain-containing protein, partial [Actinomycetes bacterium]